MNTQIKKKNFHIGSKKHAEQFFFSKDKKYPYYFKNKKLDISIEKNENKNNLSYNFEYGLKGVGKSFYFEIRTLVAIIKYMRRFSKKLLLKKNKLQLRMCVFPDISLTSKPREIRMGKGKGRFSRKVYFFKKGTKILEFNMVSDLFLMKEFLRRCYTRIPCKFEILNRYW